MKWHKQINEEWWNDRTLSHLSCFFWPSAIRYHSHPEPQIPYYFIGNITISKTIIVLINLLHFQFLNLSVIVNNLNYPIYLNVSCFIFFFQSKKIMTRTFLLRLKEDIHLNVIQCDNNSVQVRTSMFQVSFLHKYRCYLLKCVKE